MAVLLWTEIEDQKVIELESENFMVTALILKHGSFLSSLGSA